MSIGYCATILDIEINDLFTDVMYIKPLKLYAVIRSPLYRLRSQIGAYQNTGAPYQPLSSFQNTGSFAGPASYSSTYYNPGDYQMSGSYASGTYGTQTNLWQGGQYATYGSHQYPNYSQQDTNSAYSSTTLHCCAPKTEHISVSISSSVNSSILSGNVGYTASNNQMPAAYAPQWRPGSSSSELTSVQVWLS
ncbi:hypothetical protein C2S52_001749 [Perilla frutescens var. hirtella]|nr:hypothetical protein C2S52_001749 [Perilla frutescens var. hirtella]